MKKLFLFLCLLLIPIVYGYNASSTSYTIGSFNEVLAGDNSSSTSFDLRNSLSYQSGGSLLSVHYAANIGSFEVVNSTVPNVCGNKLVETGESCDNGINNGACPNACSASCTVNSCGSSGGGSSGGGGGGSSGGVTFSQDSSPTVTKIYDLAFGTNSVVINASSIPISDIVLDVRNDSKNVKFVLTKKDNVTTGYNISKVYSYIEVSHINIDNDNISSVKMHFIVSRSWQSTNNVLSADIILLRYNDLTGSWDELPTMLLREDANNSYYEALSPGLSLFVISSKIIRHAPVVQDAPSENIVSGNVVNNNSEDDLSNLSSESNNSDNNYKIILPSIVVVLFLMILASTIIYRNKRQQEGRHTVTVQINAPNTSPIAAPTRSSLELQLEAWILKAKSLGHSSVQLRQFLLSKGYPQKDVDEAIARTSNRLTNANINKSTNANNISSSINPSIESQLEAWILKKKALGYNSEQLKHFLIAKGYPQKDVEEAVKNTLKK